MDHLLSRVGFRPTLTTRTITVHIARKLRSEFPGNSEAAYHALNVASNAISHHHSFRVLLCVSLSVSSCAMSIPQVLPTCRSFTDRTIASNDRNRSGCVLRVSVTAFEKYQMVVPSGFEPESPAPKASMIDHYTTGLYVSGMVFPYNSVCQPSYQIGGAVLRHGDVDERSQWDIVGDYHGPVVACPDDRAVFVLRG